MIKIGVDIDEKLIILLKEMLDYEFINTKRENKNFEILIAFGIIVYLTSPNKNFPASSPQAQKSVVTELILERKYCFSIYLKSLSIEVL